MKKKQVRCWTHHELDGSWADVWIAYHDRRKVLLLGPTLMTREAVTLDLAISNQCQQQNPDLDFSGDISHGVEVLSALSVQPYYVTEECGAGVPSVHTAAAELSKAEVERMLTALLRAKGVRSPLSFRWNKPEITVRPL